MERRIKVPDQRGTDISAPEIKGCRKRDFYKTLKTEKINR
jgi:hypothetical protein